jgi:spore germination cell wall hydrolase CwlJ-like protein
MVKAYVQSSEASPHLLVGAIATTALLGAAFIGQALAHTTLARGGLWHGLEATRTTGGGDLKSAQDANAARLANGANPSAIIINPLPPPQTFQKLSPQEAAAQNAKVAFSTLPNPPAAPFRLDTATPIDRSRALDCLTMAVYYEAASEPDQGQAAVAQVVLNRVRHPLFPKTVCGVVLQGADLPTGCQFTFTCDGSLGRRPTELGWARARRVAERALDGHVEASVGEATHYHTVWVVPYWQPTVVKLTQIGAHIFYRWSGGMGRPISFAGQYAGGEPVPPALLGLTEPAVPAVTAPTKTLVAAVAAPSAPVETKAAPPPPAAQLAAITPTSEGLAQLQPTVQPTGYFGRPADQVQRLPVGSGR